MNIKIIIVLVCIIVCVSVGGHAKSNNKIPKTLGKFVVLCSYTLIHCSHDHVTLTSLYSILEGPCTCNGHQDKFCGSRSKLGSHKLNGAYDLDTLYNCDGKNGQAQVIVKCTKTDTKSKDDISKKCKIGSPNDPDYCYT